jgi:hypothetical protein
VTAHAETDGDTAREHYYKYGAEGDPEAATARAP